MTIEEKYIAYKNLIDTRLNNFVQNKLPLSLYEPVNYALKSGGKRIRPILTIFCCEAFGGTFNDSIDAAIAMEILHNFTLVHDDIMDNANTRRGRETIHIKWDRDTAILAGDQLVAIAYNTLLKTETQQIKNITKIFTDSIEEICEGQSFDKDFEKRKDVSEDEYLIMIRKKTAKLLEGCAMIGAVIANATENEIETVRQFAENIGLAFQIQDDLFDITADENKFGKKIGGDIAEGKKTLLLIKALENISDENDRKLLLKIVNKDKEITEPDFINNIKIIYEKYEITGFAKNKILYYTQQANHNIVRIKQETGKELLEWFSNMLLKRQH